MYTDSSRYDDLQRQLDFLYPAAAGDDGHVKFQVRQPQRQKGTVDCGLFAVANALATAMNQEPEKVVLDQSKMRQHLTQCLQNEYISSFPRMKSYTRYTIKRK